MGTLCGKTREFAFSLIRICRTSPYEYSSPLLGLLGFALLMGTMLSAQVVETQNNPPVHLLCEAMQEPLGIDITHPQLSWQIHAARRGASQTAYEIRVASSSEAWALDKADVWDSGKIK